MQVHSACWARRPPMPRSSGARPFSPRCSIIQQHDVLGSEGDPAVLPSGGPVSPGTLTSPRVTLWTETSSRGPIAWPVPSDCALWQLISFQCGKGRITFCSGHRTIASNRLRLNTKVGGEGRQSKGLSKHQSCFALWPEAAGPCGSMDPPPQSAPAPGPCQEGWDGTPDRLHWPSLAFRSFSTHGWHPLP